MIIGPEFTVTAGGKYESETGETQFRQRGGKVDLNKWVTPVAQWQRLYW